MPLGRTKSKRKRPGADDAKDNESEVAWGDEVPTWQFEEVLRVKRSKLGAAFEIKWSDGCVTWVSPDCIHPDEREEAFPFLRDLSANHIDVKVMADGSCVLKDKKPVPTLICVGDAADFSKPEPIVTVDFSSVQPPTSHRRAVTMKDNLRPQNDATRIAVADPKKARLYIPPNYSGVLIRKDDGSLATGKARSTCLREWRVSDVAIGKGLDGAMFKERRQSSPSEVELGNRRLELARGKLGYPLTSSVGCMVGVGLMRIGDTFQFRQTTAVVSEALTLDIKVEDGAEALEVVSDLEQYDYRDLKQLYQLRTAREPVTILRVHQALWPFYPPLPKFPQSGIRSKKTAWIEPQTHAIQDFDQPATQPARKPPKPGPKIQPSWPRSEPEAQIDTQVKAKPKPDDSQKRKRSRPEVAEGKPKKLMKPDPQPTYIPSDDGKLSPAPVQYEPEVTAESKLIGFPLQPSEAPFRLYHGFVWRPSGSGTSYRFVQGSLFEVAWGVVQLAWAAWADVFGKGPQVYLLGIPFRFNGKDLDLWTYSAVSCKPQDIIRPIMIEDVNCKQQPRQEFSKLLGRFITYYTKEPLGLLATSRAREMSTRLPDIMVSSMDYPKAYRSLITDATVQGVLPVNARVVPWVCDVKDLDFSLTELVALKVVTPGMVIECKWRSGTVKLIGEEYKIVVGEDSFHLLDFVKNTKYLKSGQIPFNHVMLPNNQTLLSILAVISDPKLSFEFVGPDADVLFTSIPALKPSYGEKQSNTSDVKIHSDN